MFFAVLPCFICLEEGIRGSVLTWASPLPMVDHLAGLVVKRPPREQKIQGSNPACDGIFPGRVIPVT